MYISFNPQYYLKSDNGRALVLSAQVGRTNTSPIGDNFETIIHPLHAMILSFFYGQDKYQALKEIEEKLRINSKKLEHLINLLINNSKYVRVRCKEGLSIFPPYTLITNNSRTLNKRFNWSEFIYDTIDLSAKRHFTPTSITLMVNNICHTNCYYCYADKRHKVTCSIPIERIKELIKEAKMLNVRTFDVIGGEFFLYKDWYIILEELHKYGYHPYLSTKLPLNEETIRKLSDLRIQDIQISLDSLIGSHLQRSLGVSSEYISKIKNTICLLDRYNISMYIHTVLSKETETVDDIRSIFEFIKDIKSIVEWKIDKAGKSLYTKESYDKIEARESSIDEISRYIADIRPEVVFSIRSPRPMVANQLVAKKASFNFFDRGFCSGNYSSLFILPDGNVTMCEELYWIDTFFLGNVLQSSLEEIWNSSRALSLFNIKQESVPSDSLCSKCKDFVKCRSLKQVCYKEIIKNYGEDKWYYPDVNCPYTKNVEI